MGESDPRIIIPMPKGAMKMNEAMEQNMIPLRIRCPECQRIYTLFIKDFDQGLHTLLGESCPYCKRFIRESDDPDKLIIDAKEVRERMEKDAGNKP